MAIKSCEQQVSVDGFVPPQIHDTLIYHNPYDETEPPVRVLVETVQLLGKHACQVGGTYLSGDNLGYADATLENTEPNAEQTYGIAQFMIRDTQPSQ